MLVLSMCKESISVIHKAHRQIRLDQESKKGKAPQYPYKLLLLPICLPFPRNQCGKYLKFPASVVPLKACIALVVLVVQCCCLIDSCWREAVMAMEVGVAPVQGAGWEDMRELTRALRPGRPLLGLQVGWPFPHHCVFSPNPRCFPGFWLSFCFPQAPLDYFPLVFSCAFYPSVRALCVLVFAFSLLALSSNLLRFHQKHPFVRLVFALVACISARAWRCLDSSDSRSTPVDCQPGHTTTTTTTFSTSLLTRLSPLCDCCLALLRVSCILFCCCVSSLWWWFFLFRLFAWLCLCHLGMEWNGMEVILLWFVGEE
ncbi:hypothetical protein QBC43DRAFT_8384 [Cladorrhinum sp. PSN259]|nr:hypothetical protein QBC43DRAFT_8384 [Cladorrhinum sp. PSN259]